MFRLPLRNERKAQHSERFNRAVTLKTIDRLFARFQPDIFNCPLFLNSVRSIQLEEIEACTGKLVKSYANVATLSPEDQE
jgi:hypothetical protein